MRSDDWLPKKSLRIGVTTGLIHSDFVAAEVTRRIWRAPPRDLGGYTALRRASNFTRIHAWDMDLRRSMNRPWGWQKKPVLALY